MNITSIKAKFIDAETRGNRCLADANEAHEAGRRATAERLYERGQRWLDRANELQERIWLAEINERQSSPEKEPKQQG